MSRPTRGSRKAFYPYGAVTRYGPPFQTVPVLTSVTTGLVRVRSPLLAESRLMSFPPGTEMFQFPGFASPAYGFSRRYRLSGGLPHSEILGSKPARGSPWLFAACHVLHRLSVPRHPPDALQTLDLTTSTTDAPRAGVSPQGTRHQPAAHPAKMHHMTQPTVSACEATALSGHPRSLMLFTCQRSHTRLGGYLLSLSTDIVAAGSPHGHRHKVTVIAPSSWWRRTGSNRRPHACKARALPTELRPHGEGSGGTVVGQGRLELPTSRLSSVRSNQLSY